MITTKNCHIMYQIHIDYWRTGMYWSVPVYRQGTYQCFEAKGQGIVEVEEEEEEGRRGDGGERGRKKRRRWRT